MDLASPAPEVETAEAEPIGEIETAYAEPAPSVEEAVAESCSYGEPSQKGDDAKKFAPRSSNQFLEQSSKMSVAALRRDGGADFESRVAVSAGGAKKNFLRVCLPWFFDQRDFVTFSEISRFIVVKRNCCFVYLEPTDDEPLYAFSLSELNAEIEDPNKPDKYSYTVDPSTNTNKTSNKLTTVILRHKYINQGKLAYQLTFDTSKEKGVVKKFLEVMERAGQPIVASLVDSGKSKKSKN